MDITRFLPINEYNAAVGANNPSASNVFATINDLPDTLYSADGILAGNRTVQGSGSNFNLAFQNLGDYTVGAIGDVNYITSGGSIGFTTNGALTEVVSFTATLGSISFTAGNGISIINNTANGIEIRAFGAGNLALDTPGSGRVTIEGLTYPDTDGNANDVMITNGAGILSFVDVATLVPASTNIYNADGALTGARTVTMGTDNLTFASSGNADLIVVDATNDRIGFGVAAPGYGIHFDLGNVFFDDSNVAIGGTPPDTSHKFRVATDNTDGNNFTGARIDLSHTTATGAFSGIQVRSTSAISGASSTIFGINSNITGSATAGTHDIVAGRFRAAKTQAGTSTVNNYGIQVEDGTEGTVGHVLASVSADGKANWVDPNTLITLDGDGIYGGSGAVPTTVVSTLTDTLEFTNGASRAIFGASQGYLDIEVPVGSTNPIAFYENRVGGANVGDTMTMGWHFNDSAGARQLGNSNITTRVIATGAGTVTNTITFADILQVRNGGGMLLSQSAVTDSPIAFFEIDNDPGSPYAGCFLVTNRDDLASSNMINLRNRSFNSALIVDGTLKATFNNNQTLTADVQFKGATDVNLLYIDVSANEVGIGINSPLSKLHVRGNTVGAAANTLYVDNNSASPIIVARDDRFVGMRTSGPTALAETIRLNGESAVTNGGLFVSSGVTAASTYADLNSGLVSSGAVFGFNAGANTNNVNFKIFNDNDTDLLVATTDGGDGRVGIMTANANIASTLTVTGDIEVIGQTEGVILQDRTSGTRYRVYIDATGVLHTEAA